MKKIIALLVVFFAVANTAFAERKEITQTQETDIICTIDGLFVESYAIKGFMYLPIDKLSEYGFNLNQNTEGIQLSRNEIIYFDSDYTPINTRGNIPVYENLTPVTINGKPTNTYVVEDRIVMQADELLAFGDVTWNEDAKKVQVSIIENELINRLENAEGKVRETGDEIEYFGQKKDGVWNGMVKTGAFQSMTYIGYMIDGEYEGVVFGYRQHQPYLAALSELKTVRNGVKNGYCRFATGYNNKPEQPNTIKYISGIYEDDKLKNGEYTIYTDFYMNTATFKVRDFQEQIISSTRNVYEYEKSPSQIFYNGQLIEFDVAAVIEEDRTLIPLRGLLEKMGAVVEWDEYNKTAVVTKDDTTLSVKINHYGVKVNDSDKYMDVPARLVDGRTMIPLRFLSEELGFKVDWDEGTNAITISE